MHKGPNYIRPNQTYLHSAKNRETQLKREQNNIMNVITPHLVRVHHMPNTSPVITELSRQIETYLHQRYMAPLSYCDIYRIQREYNLIQSIQSRLRKGKFILRVSDKSGIFHIGHATDYEQKAAAYRQKTGAYIELEDDPFWMMFDKVVCLLNHLLSKDHIRVWQLNKLMPKRNKVQLAYLYFIPKSHKVLVESYLFEFNRLLQFFFPERHTITTNCLLNAYTNNSNLEVSGPIDSTII